MKNLVLFISILFLSSCASKTLVKKCVPTVDEQYYVCETIIFK